MAVPEAVAVSLRSLCRQRKLKIKRLEVEYTDSMSSKKTYDTSNRSECDGPREIWCRVAEASADDRVRYDSRGMEVSHRVYTMEENPKVREDDRLYDDNDEFVVRGVLNPDRLNRYWVILCDEFRGVPM